MRRWARVVFSITAKVQVRVSWQLGQVVDGGDPESGGGSIGLERTIAGSRNVMRAKCFILIVRSGGLGF